MSKKKRRRKSKAKSPAKTRTGSSSKPQSIYPEESRGAELVTVAWMLCMLMTTVAVIAAVGWWLLEFNTPPREDGTVVKHVGSSLMLFIATATGTACLLLTWPAHRLRTMKPPHQITLLAMVIGAIPLVATAIVAVVSRSQ